MNISTDKIVSISEANQNFSKTARLAERLGEVYIFKNNKPKYKLVLINEKEDQTEENDKKMRRVLKVFSKYKKAFEELIKAYNQN